MNTERGLPPIEAMLYRQEGEMLVCELCAHYCKLKDGRLGICGVRKRIGNKLYTLVYGKAIASAIDPIEKSHFFMSCRGRVRSQSPRSDAISGVRFARIGIFRKNAVSRRSEGTSRPKRS